MGRFKIIIFNVNVWWMEHGVKQRGGVLNSCRSLDIIWDPQQKQTSYELCSLVKYYTTTSGKASVLNVGSPQCCWCTNDKKGILPSKETTNQLTIGWLRDFRCAEWNLMIESSHSRFSFMFFRFFKGSVDHVLCRDAVFFVKKLWLCRWGNGPLKNAINFRKCGTFKWFR